MSAGTDLTFFFLVFFFDGGTATVPPSCLRGRRMKSDSVNDSCHSKLHARRRPASETQLKELLCFNL